MSDSLPSEQILQGIENRLSPVSGLPVKIELQWSLKAKRFWNAAPVRAIPGDGVGAALAPCTTSVVALPDEAGGHLGKHRLDFHINPNAHAVIMHLHIMPTKISIYLYRVLLVQFWKCITEGSPATALARSTTGYWQ